MSSPVPNFVVFDTNCWVSNFLFPNGMAARAVELALAYSTICHSPATLEELTDVLSRPKFDEYATLEDRSAYTYSVASSGQIIEPQYHFEIFADPTDNKFFDLAYSAAAKYLVSGDKKHVLPMKHRYGVQIVSPALFLEIDLDNTRGIWPDYRQGMELRKKPPDRDE